MAITTTTITWSAPAAVAAVLLLTATIAPQIILSPSVGAYPLQPLIRKHCCRLPAAQAPASTPSSLSQRVKRSHAAITTLPSWNSRGPSSSSSLSLSSLPLILFASTSNNDGDNNNEGTQSASSSPPTSSSSAENTDKRGAAPSSASTAAAVIPDPPPLLSVGYNVAGLANVFAALGLLFNIGKINDVAASASASSLILSSSLLPSASVGAVNNARIMATRYQPNLLATYTAGSLGYLLLAAGTCNILSDSVKTKRLYTSDTYKRLTMGLILFGLVGLFSVPGESGCIIAGAASSSSSFWSGGGGATAIFMMTLFAKVITAIVSFIGWEYSAGGFGSSSLSSHRGRMKNVVREVCGGCARVWKTLSISDKRPATFYRSFFVFLTLGNLVFNTPELIFNLRQGMGLMSLPVSLTISSIARLGLMSVILYVLKDAAERKRLDGTTFIKLNMMVGLWALGGE